MEVPRNWRLKQQRYAMVGAVCPHCDAKIFPPREVCPECGLEAKAPLMVQRSSWRGCFSCDGRSSQAGISSGPPGTYKKIKISAL
jgi:predicted amidophosphoribosyltransferase